MTLTPSQAQCLAGQRGDVITFYAGYGWSRNDPGAIFTDWWNKNIAAGKAPQDTAAAYRSLEDYAVALCGNPSGSVQPGGGGSAPPPAPAPGGGGGIFGSGDVTQRIWEYMQREPLIAIAGLWFVALTVRRLARSE